jgi:hypothetical protein
MPGGKVCLGCALVYLAGLIGLSTNLCFVFFLAEIVMFDDHLVVYKNLGDLMFYVTGSQEENELILYTVLQAFYESVSILLR